MFRRVLGASVIPSLFLGDGFVWSAKNGFMASKGEFAFDAINPNYSGDRFITGSSGVGLRLFADHAGSNDDGIIYSSVMPTARAGAFTTVLQFHGEASAYQMDVLAYVTGSHSHVCRLQSNGSFLVGYYGYNGSDRYLTTQVGEFDHSQTAPHTVVISTVPGSEVVISIDGRSPIMSGLINTIAVIGAGSNPLSVAPRISDHYYPAYYHFNGLLYLYSCLPGVYVSQMTADAISFNPSLLICP